MDDEPADVGAADPEPRLPQLDPASDKALRDAEFTLFYADLPRLVGFLVVQGAHPNLAADIAQDAMTEAYRQWDHLDAPLAWVRTVASRRWWDRSRRDRIELPHEEIPEPGLLLSAEEAEEITHRHTFLALLHGLPPLQRQVMAWTYDGYRPTEIAAVLGKPPATVRSALREARIALRRTYRPDEETS
jgi:RNA polymerase sigma-70 factor (ECF subfamily)